MSDALLAQVMPPALLSKFAERSQDFRYLFADTFQLVINETEVRIVFGIQNNPGTPDPAMEAQTCIITTPRGAKMLAQLLGKFIADVEEVFGPISVDQAQLDAADAIIAEVKAARQPK